MRPAFWRAVAVSAFVFSMTALGTGPKAATVQAVGLPIPNMIAYWDFEDPIAGTTCTDKSASTMTGLVGTLTNGATITNAQRAPIPATGNAQSLNLVKVSNSHLLVPDNNVLDLTGSFTITAWIRHTIDSVDQQGIVEKFDDTPAIANGYIFRLNASECLSVGCVPAAGGTVGASTQPRAIGDVVNGAAWHHVAGVYDSGAQTITMYEDAVVDATVGSSIPAPAAGTAPLHIGADYGMNSFEGQIDEVRIYTRPLVANEVAVFMVGQPPPTALVLTPGPGFINVDWTAPAAPASGVTVTYTVQRSTSGTGPWTTVASGIPYGTTSFLNNGLTAGTYFYRVFAISVMESLPLGPASATALNGTPRSGSDNDEGWRDGKCSCGTSIGSGPGIAFWVAALAALVMLAVRRS